MKLYLSKTTKIKSFDGIHFLQDHIGTSHKSPWNDYSFTTSFNVYLVREGEKLLVGAVKVLAKGAKDTASYLESKGELVLDENIVDVTNAFEASLVVSIAADISYYQKINMLFEMHVVEEFLASTCDASYYSDNIDEYRGWPGFKESLLRNGSSSESIIKKGKSIAAGNYEPDEKFEISIDCPDALIETVNLSFSSKREFGESNFNIIIGKNGVGKTHVLRRLTELVTGVAKDTKKWPYFNKLLVVAYSPFEDFYTKSSLQDRLDSNFFEKVGIAPPFSDRQNKRRLLHINKYEYIGFRNEIGKFSLEWPKKHSALSVLKILQLDIENQWWEGQSRVETLIETLGLCIDFDNIVLKCKSEAVFKLHRDSTLTMEDLRAIRKDVDSALGVFFEKNEQNIPLSSGQAIYSYLIPCLVAEIEDESLVIIDEPELYLHPALEVGLISMLKSLLARTSSYALVATHSAIMAREVDKNHIKILQKRGDFTEVLNPTFQTLGESLELILGEAFDDYITKKPYQSDLDSLTAGGNDRNEVVRLISNRIGDEGLAYILSACDKCDDVELVELDETP